MSWLITPQIKSLDGVPVGTPYGGGYIAGFISHTADGNPTHALIVAPRATGATGSSQWKTTATTTAGTGSSFDGAANTAAMVTAGIDDHPAAQFCVNLSIGGFTDWYLPARYELDIAYFNLKPSTDANSTSLGTNIYAVPQRNINWTTTYPAQTALTAFNTTAEAFVADNHWSSSENTGFAIYGWFVNFFSGFQGDFRLKTNGLRVRAFRRIAL